MKVTCPNCNTELEVTKPKGNGTPRGVLNGIALEDMTLEQLRIEKRNAKSVLYKSEKAGATEEMLAPKRERVAAVEARIAEVAPTVAPKVAAVAVAVAVVAEEAVAEEAVAEEAVETTEE